MQFRISRHEADSEINEKETETVTKSATGIDMLIKPSS